MVTIPISHASAGLGSGSSGRSRSQVCFFFFYVYFGWFRVFGISNWGSPGLARHGYASCPLAGPRLPLLDGHLFLGALRATLSCTDWVERNSRTGLYRIAGWLTGRIFSWRLVLFGCLT